MHITPCWATGQQAQAHTPGYKWRAGMPLPSNLNALSHWPLEHENRLAQSLLRSGRDLAQHKSWTGFWLTERFILYHRRTARRAGPCTQRGQQRGSRQRHPPQPQLTKHKAKAATRRKNPRPVSQEQQPPATGRSNMVHTWLNSAKCYKCC